MQAADDLARGGTFPPGAAAIDVGQQVIPIVRQEVARRDAAVAG